MAVFVPAEGVADQRRRRSKRDARSRPRRQPAATTAAIAAWLSTASRTTTNSERRTAMAAMPAGETVGCDEPARHTRSLDFSAIRPVGFQAIRMMTTAKANTSL